MISGIFGLPGSGKTLYLSYLADRAVKGKNLNFRNQFYSMFQSYEKVYTTFPFSGAYQLDFELLGKVKFENCLILIDEIMMFCDSRNFKSFGENLKFFFSQHRHFSIDIVYASQAYDDVDKKIRNVTDSYYHISRWLGSYSRIQPIRSTFGVSGGSIVSAYEYGSIWEDYFFNRKKFYDLADTNFSVAVPNFQEYTPQQWSSSLINKVV